MSLIVTKKFNKEVVLKRKKYFKTIMLVFTTFIILSSVSFVFLGCEERTEEHQKSDLKIHINEDITVEKWSVDKTNVVDPNGIVLLNGALFVTDKEKDSIVVLDEDGNYIRDSLENELFLLNPTVIKTDGNYLYVIDSGMNQIKILSQEFDLVRCINLPSLDQSSDYWDLEVINENIYLSCITSAGEDAIIYELGKNDVIQKMGDKFIGYISEFNNELMAANSLEYFEGRTEKGLKSEGGKTGKNNMYEMLNNELKIKFEYAYGYIPLDFIFLDDYIFSFSAAYASLDKYTMDGQYVETLLKLDFSRLFIQLESVDNCILITCPAEKAIYKVVLD
jgi:hypothetical protein